MSTASIAIAMQEIEQRFRSVWEHKCDYPNTNFDVKKEVKASDIWARYVIKHALGQQSSLANVLGEKRFDREGSIIIQVFTPLNKGVLSAYSAAEIVVNAYEGKSTPSGVWFRNVRMNEIDSDENSWKQINVIIDFIYDQIH